MYVDTFEALEAIADSMRPVPDEARTMTGAHRAKLRASLRVTFAKGRLKASHRAARVSLAYLSCLDARS